MRQLGVVLLSGGLDSTTVATLACRRDVELSALSVRYGQSHERELESARQVAFALDLPHQVLDGSFFKDLAWYSALTSAKRFERPLDRSAEAMPADIPITYVPLRNTFLLALGAAWLESRALATLEEGAASPADLSAMLFIGANAVDYSGYPDCRPEFYAAMGETLRLGSKLGTQYGVPIRIEAPLIDKRKADIVRLAVEIGAPIDLTWSCYGPGPQPCGRCDSCLLRAKGFTEAGITDPAAGTR